MYISNSYYTGSSDGNRNKTPEGSKNMDITGDSAKPLLPLHMRNYLLRWFYYYMTENVE